MYERFTDRARKAVQSANNVALKYFHEYLGTEHLLLALLEEEGGTIIYVLRELKLDAADLARRVRAMIQAGPETTTIVGRLPQTPRFKKLIEAAIMYSRDLNDNFVGTEHLFLGLMASGVDSVSGAVLSAAGCDIDKAKRAVIKLKDTPITVYSATCTLQEEQPASPGQELPTERHAYPIDPQRVTPGVYEAYFRYSPIAPGILLNIAQSQPPRVIMMVYQGATGFPRYVTAEERGERGAEAADWMRIAKMVKLTNV